MAEALSCVLLLLGTAALAAGQLFDCRRDQRHVKEGDTIVRDCQRLICVRGDFEPDGCEISNACRGRCSATGGAIVFSPPFLVKLPVKLPPKVPTKPPGPLPGPLSGVFPHPPPLPPRSDVQQVQPPKQLQPLKPLRPLQPLQHLQPLLPLPPRGLLPLPLRTPGSCSDNGLPVANGQVLEAPGCRQLSCRDGVLTTRFCEEVPPGCTVAKRDTASAFPDCCPVWSCVGAGSGGAAGSLGVGFVGSGSGGAAAVAARLQDGSCVQAGGRTMHSGQTVFGPGCVKYVCRKGVLTTHGCSTVPAGCTPLPPALGKPFPACCTRWNCIG
ncbi:hypothetical protein FJT64_000642 [Amphibalanus amphitrite]|uniref:Single domain-containing protein n=1 Tax=Amphibalanus amphitrite TaxID=1232801 RepID=A0A6A4VUV6_AMPAM|nr:hypothetical protein FJT64_000642 [Amphibalanus amphitrite]